MKLFKYQSINKNSLSGLASGTLWMSKAANFNDPFEFATQPSLTVSTDLPGQELDDPPRTKLYEDLNGRGVISLSARDDNILMWSHYAAEHTGMCLGFEPTETFDLSGDKSPFRKVEYSSDLPKVMDYDNFWGTKASVPVLTTKADDWRYEEEYRIILERGDGSFEYGRVMRLVSVIFGCRAADEDKLLVKRSLGDRSVQFLEAVMSPHKYRIIICPL